MKLFYQLALAGGCLLLAGRVQAQNLLPKPDFGTASNPAAAPTDFATDLTLDTTPTNGSSSQGTYVVQADPKAFNGNFTTTYDHTVNTSSGVYMMVDGPSSSATAVWRQVVAVQPGRSYTFSYWQRNLADGTNAMLQLKYKGSSATAATTAAPVSSSGGNTAALPNASFQATGTGWQQVTYTITVGSADTNLTLALYDLVTSGGGNDFGLDDMSLTQASSTGGIAGTVFEDVNFGGGAGRTFSTASNSAKASGFTAALARPGAKVELYGTTGNTAGVLLSTTSTDNNGFYNFPAPTVASSTSYTVRVVSSSVSSARAGYVSGLLPVVTLAAGATDQVGGPNPALPDAPANSGTQKLPELTTTQQAAEALGTVAVPSSGNQAGVDFGFNFDLVVNAKVSGQGSLAQFIVNANALGNESQLAQAGSYLNEIVGTGATTPALPAVTESSIFMVPNGKAHPGLRANDGSSTGGPASQLNSSGLIAIAITAANTALPAVTGAATVINAWTQAYNVDNSNNVALGTGGTVGAAGAQLPQLDGPEVQVAGNTNNALGLDLQGAGSGVLGLAIYGFGNGVDSDANAQIRVSGSNVLVQGCVVGTAATSFSQPGTASAADGIRLTAGSGAAIKYNLVGYCNGIGIFTKTGSSGASISFNEVRGNNLQKSTILSGIDTQGNGNTISNNLVAANAGAGLDSQDPNGTSNPVLGSTGSNVWSGNTVTGNGVGWSDTAPRQRVGVRIYGSSNTVSQNIIASNYGDGVLVTTGAQASISQNAIYGNGDVASANGTAATGQIGIDLLINATSQDPVNGTPAYVTPNGSSTASGGANSLIYFPVLQSAVLQNTSSGTTLTVTGQSTSGYTVELFIAQANTASVTSSDGRYVSNTYGQGSSYIGSVVVPGNATGNGTTFTATIQLSSLTPAQQKALTTAGSKLTSTATLSSLGTSEFSLNLATTSQPSVFNVTNLRVATGAVAAVLNPGLTSPQAASDPVYSISTYTVGQPTGGTLTYTSNGTSTTITGPTAIPAGNMSQLTYTPPTTAGNYTFTFTATNSNGTSTIGNPATYTIPVSSSSNGFVANDDGLDAPKSTSGSGTNNAGGTSTSGNVVLNDTNSNNTTNFTAAVVNGPTNGYVTLGADGAYTYTPNNGYIGSDSFTYNIATVDSNNNKTVSNTATVTINVYDPSRVCSAATGPNLLANAGFESGNDGSFTSAYTYVARPASKATSSPDGLYPESKYAVDADANYYHANFQGLGHGGSGNFMIVNGAANQSKVYAQQVSVVANRYYTFSGWAQSVNGTSPAVLGFVINGKSASTATKLSTTVGQYQQFSGVWFSGSNNSVAFEVRDITRDANGNDFGLDDLYFGTCNVDLTANNVTNSPAVSQGTPSNLSALSATLGSGSALSISSFVVQTLPAFGTLRLGGPSGTTVVAGQQIPASQRNALYYVPNGSGGTATFTYTALDSEGSGSQNVATYTIPVNNGPLPVQLAAFTARAAAQAAQLDWLTASELNNDHFEVERSLDGRTFTKIGQVAGQGSKATATRYQFVDRNAAAVGQLVYYRLRQVDADGGGSSYSPVRAVSFAAAGTPLVGLYPNPTAGPGTQLDLSALPATSTYQVRLLDATGRQVAQWALPGGQPQPLPEVAGLASGTYLLHVSGQQANGLTLRQVLHLTKE